MNLNKIYFSIILLIPTFIFPQGNFNIDYDYSLMCLDDTSGYIEIYYSFRPLEMKEVVTENDTCITGILFVKIGEIETDRIFVDRVWQFNRCTGDQNSQNDNNNLVGLFRFALPQGNYFCELLAKDGNDSLKQTNGRFEFDIKTLNNDRFTLSDLQLASSISKTSTENNSPFYKNNYEVVPNPSLMFGGQLPVVFLYCELYGLNIGAKSETLEIEYALVNASDQEIFKKTKYVPSSAPSLVFVKTINIRNYQTGRYKINLTVSDLVRTISEGVYKNLYIYNPHIVDTSDAGVNAVVIASEYFALSEEEIDEIFAFSQYVASDIEIREWDRQSSLNDKRVFLYHFWRARDLTPQDSRNEFKSEYLRRVNITNERYQTLNKKGWATDQGRVYCLYAEPSYIERFPAETGERPYEIWRYEQIEGGAIFIFADLYGFSDMSLIHSTKLGELRDDNWRRKVNAFR